MSAVPLRPIAPKRFRRSHVSANVETLVERIAKLVTERQLLRARGAGTVALERNRVRLARSQWELSHALIERNVLKPGERSAA